MKQVDFIRITRLTPKRDAGMRQIKAEAYMHNRLRMNVSSYLYCNLLM